MGGRAGLPEVLDAGEVLSEPMAALSEAIQEAARFPAAGRGAVALVTAGAEPNVAAAAVGAGPELTHLPGEIDPPTKTGFPWTLSAETWLPGHKKTRSLKRGP